MSAAPTAPPPSTGGPLSGRTIVVTRPAAQCEPLAAAIRAQGGQAYCHPLLEISAVPDPQPLQAAAARLADYALVFFVSPNAVEHALPVFLTAQTSWPTGVRASTVGPGSVAALRRFGIAPVLAPEQDFDSEAVLALPEFQSAAITGRRILIVRGNGGRPLLGDTLRARGAAVDTLCAYQRLPAQELSPMLRHALREGVIDAMILTSSEAADQLARLLGPAEPASVERKAMQHVTLFVSHPRIAERTQQHRLPTPKITEPGDAAMLDALCRHFAPRNSCHNSQ